MSVVGNHSGYVFSRNPIVVEVPLPPDTSDTKGGKFTLQSEGNHRDLYQGRFVPPLTLDLSEIVDAEVAPFTEVPEGNVSPFVQIESEERMEFRKFTFWWEYDSYEGELTFTVIPGGISRQNLRRLSALGTDIFSSRFLSAKGNFFLTTRTAGWLLAMKETEICPLYFFITHDSTNLAVTDAVSGVELLFDDYDLGVYAMDVNALRRLFVEQHRILPSVMDISIDGNSPCRLVIEAAQSSRQRCRIKFRNSLGVFEIVEMTGPVSFSPDFSDGEEATFEAFDTTVYGYSTERDRFARKQTITVESGVKRQDEILFMMDMLTSEEVYLLDVYPEPVRVIPSAEELSYMARPDSPMSATVKLTLSDSDTNLTPDIAGEDSHERPRIFSKQFSKQFN